jgi:hypothetical protein
VLTNGKTLKISETRKYVMVPITPPPKTWKDSLPIDMLLCGVSVLVFALPSSEIQEGLMNYSVEAIFHNYCMFRHLAFRVELFINVFFVLLQYQAYIYWYYLICFHIQTAFLVSRTYFVSISALNITRLLDIIPTDCPRLRN